MAASDYTSLVQEFYVGFYGRPADADGLKYWSERVDFFNGDFTSVLNAFANSAEADEYVYTDPDTGDKYTNTELVENVYQDLFGRAADDAGLEWYVGKLDSGEYTVQDVVKRVIDGAQGEDSTVLANKVKVAEYFTDNLGDATYGSDEIADARAVLSDVEADDASVLAALDLADSTIEEMGGGAGETFTLTTGIDDITGTSGDDVIDGMLDGTDDTFSVADSINGAGGTDTLRIISDQTSFDAGIADISNVETLKYYNKGAVALATVDLDDDGFTSFILDEADAAGGGLAISGLESTTSVEIGDLDDNTLTMTYSDAAGTGDSASITIGDAITGSVVLAAGMETVNLKMTGSATVIDGASLAGANATAINIEAGDDADDDQEFSGFATAANAVVTVTGKGDLDLSVLAATIKTVNAADSEGGITATTNGAQTGVTGGKGNDVLTLVAPTAKLDVNTGAGDDIVTISAFDTIAGKIDGTNVKIDGGAGSLDALVSDEADFTAAAMIANVNKTTNFEVLAGTAVVTALDADDYTDIDTFAFSGDLALSTFTVENDDTIALTGAATTTLTVTPVLDSSDDVLNLKLDAKAASAAHASITVSQMETVNIESVADTALANTNTITNLVTQNNTKINITGDADLTMTTSVGTELNIIGSDATGDLDITVVGGNDKITTGSGNDTIDGAAGVDTIDAGAGDDNITGGVGDDILTGGTGQDTFVYATGTDGMDTIKDFTAGTGGDIYDTNFAPTSGLVVESVAAAAGSVALDTASSGIFTVSGTLQAAITDYTDGSEVLDAISGTSVTVSANTNAGLLALTDGGNTYVYEFTEGATVAADAILAGGDIALVGIWENVTATDLVDANFV